MATTSARRMRKPVAPVRHDAGTVESVALVRGFIRQEARRRIRREEEREIAQRLLNRERRRLI